MNQVLDNGRYCTPVTRAMRVAGFQLSETCYLPGTMLPAHSHANWYICYIPQGFYHETADGRERLCQPHMLTVHPAGETHSEQFHHHLTRSLNIEGPGEVHQPQVYAGGLLPHLASRVCNAFIDQDPQRVESLLYELLAALQNEAPPAREPAWLRTAREMLQEKITHPSPITDIADSLGVQPTHLATAFRRFHHCTAGDYLRRLRVEQACRQIARGTGFAGIALDCGFYDQSHLTRTFRKVMGVTPGEYKSML